jgi:predicted ArsR family transcriptional regulator
MAKTRFDQRFFASTRGRIIQLLRRGSRTVDELSEALDLTDNGVRGHLATLERDGIVEQTGVRRGTGKPAFTYGLTAEADSLFPKPYGRVLRHLLDEIGGRLSSRELDELMAAVGRRLAAGWPSPAGDQGARLQAAAALLNELGGLADIEDRDSRVFLRGYSCPLAAAAPGHPEICHLAAALVSEIVKVPVREHCDRGEQPLCCFEVMSG